VIVLVILVIAVIGLASFLSPPVNNQPTQLERVLRATAFLASTYDSKVGLISETPHLDNFWLYSDNNLAVLALQKAGSSNSTLVAIANNISRTIEGYSKTLGSVENQYMILGGDWDASCVIQGSSNYGVTKIRNSSVMVRLTNESDTLLESDYADTAFLKAVCLQNHGDHNGALAELNQGWRFFDGTGFRDRAYNESQPPLYQTYKLALYVYASKLLSEPVDKSALGTLLRMQAQNGGFYSGYDSSFSHEGTDTNTETTSLAVLALSAV